MANTTKSKNDSEVLELEVIEEVPLEKTIENTLVKNNVTDQVIADLKKNYGGMKLRDIEDKEMYLEIKTAKNNTRKIGILVEKLCKKGREDAIAIQKKWLSKEKSVLAQIAEVEEPLQKEIDRFDSEVERKENEAAKRREEKFINRQATLFKLGSAYLDGSYVLNHISYEATLIKESDDDIWAETILPKYQREYEKNESARVAEEKKREEEAAKMKAEREALEEQQRIFKEQQEAFAKQQAMAEKIIQEQKHRKVAARSNQLVAMGMAFDVQKDAYVFQDISVDNKTELGVWSDSDWDDLIHKIAPIIEDKKADLELNRQAEIKQREQEAVDRAVAEEKEKQRKLAEQIEIDRKRAEAAKVEEAERATDKVKWQSFVAHINSKPFPEMKNSTYKYKVTEASKLIDKINNL